MKKRQRKKKGARLGQHFLVNPQVAKAVAEGARVMKNDLVLEIGPGKGMLTRVLLSMGTRVVAVEKDPAMVALLNETFKKEISDQRLVVREDDIRNFLTLSTIYSPLSTSYKVAANIPYYITGELLRMFLTTENQPKSIAFLIQKEVAQRITGYGKRQPDGAIKESVLSLSVKVYGTPRYVKTVSRGNFNPPPNVDSAILAITDISRKNFKNVSEEMFFKIVKAGFAQKRKKLSGNLKKLFGNRTEKIFSDLTLDPRIRAEDVGLSVWLSLAKNL